MKAAIHIEAHISRYLSRSAGAFYFNSTAAMSEKIQSEIIAWGVDPEGDQMVAANAKLTERAGWGRHELRAKDVIWSLLRPQKILWGATAGAVAPQRVAG